MGKVAVDEVGGAQPRTRPSWARLGERSRRERSPEAVEGAAAGEVAGAPPRPRSFSTRSGRATEGPSRPRPGASGERAPGLLMLASVEGQQISYACLARSSECRRGPPQALGQSEGK